MCHLGTSPCPFFVCCVRLIFVGFWQPWNPGCFQLRCVSGLSLDLTLGVHLLRLLWRERLVPRKSAIHHAVQALSKPWKTAWKIGRCETGCKSTCLQGLYYILYSKWPAPKMHEHPQTHSHCVTKLEINEEWDVIPKLVDPIFLMKLAHNWSLRPLTSRLFGTWLSFLPQWIVRGKKERLQSIWCRFFPQRKYPQKIWPYMVQYLHFRILKFPLIKPIQWKSGTSSSASVSPWISWTTPCPGTSRFLMSWWQLGASYMPILLVWIWESLRKLCKLCKLIEFSDCRICRSPFLWGLSNDGYHV